MKRLSISLGAALVVTVWVWMFLRSQQQKLEERFVMTTVLRAKKYIAPGRAITVDDIEQASIPVAYLEPQALRAKPELKDKSGADVWKAKRGFKKNEQITKNGLDDSQSELRLPWIIPPEQIALTLKFAPDQAVGQAVRPGDLVHVFGTFDRRSDWPEAQSLQLVRNIRVGAVESDVWDPTQTHGQQKAGLIGDSILITLLVSPKQAGVLLLAQEKGRLALTLVSKLSTANSAPVNVAVSQLRNPL